MNTKFETVFEVDMWYKDTTDRFDKKSQYIYKCVYVDDEISVLHGYHNGVKISQRTSTPKSKRYAPSGSNDRLQFISYLGRDMEKRYTDILNDIQNLESKILDYEYSVDCLDSTISRNEGANYAASRYMTECTELIKTTSFEKIKEFITNKPKYS